MTHTANAWAQAQTAPSPEAKAVLITLADYANETGHAWPTVANLAVRTQLKPPAVRRGLRQLVEVGLIARTSRAPISRNPRYQLLGVPQASPAQPRMWIDPTKEKAAAAAWSDFWGGARMPILPMGEALYFDSDLFRPGVFRCEICSLRQIRSAFTAAGRGPATIVPATEPDKCLNGCGPTRRVTWKEECQEADQLLDTATDEVARLKKILNTPEVADFVQGVMVEAPHQVERWGADHDAGKDPLDWVWLLGHLVNKAARATIEGDTPKAQHHTISSAAALANWHAQLSGKADGMRPGIDPAAHGLDGEQA